MARISKTDHPAILRKVDQEGRKVAEVAAEYDCTPANIYALLSRLRREARPNAGAAGDPAAAQPGAEPAAIDLFASAEPPARVDPAPPSNPAQREATVTALPRPVGAAKAKPDVALMMRTADGEENATPFRSLDDLLSAVKPILRAAARSPDAVWFSIQPVDLASLESDAA